MVGVQGAFPVIDDGGGGQKLRAGLAKGIRRGEQRQDHRGIGRKRQGGDSGNIGGKERAADRVVEMLCGRTGVRHYLFSNSIWVVKKVGGPGGGGICIGGNRIDLEDAWHVGRLE